VDCVFINSQTGISGAYFIKQASELKLDLPIFTNFNTATNTQTYEITGDSINGVYFYDPYYNENSKEIITFLNEYTEKYGAKPQLLFHAISTHDAVIMSLQAIESVGNNGAEIHDWLLSNIKNWNGYMGNITFDENGNSDAGYILKKIENNNFISVN
jgi:ABC-type branched-subunit amino acid transport system substrate-binding protein